MHLHWLPLGAGHWFVKLNGRLYERTVATIGRRSARDLYHSALSVDLDDVYTIELCPEESGEHGRVAGGPVGSPLVARFRVFRYEARCWRGGEIPDLPYAVGEPVVISTDRRVAERIIELTPAIPTPTWGRDELRTGEMWNSNSVIAWLIERSGIDASSVAAPEGGRAPGWDAGVTVARRG